MTIISCKLLHSTGLVTCGISTRCGGVSPEPFGLNMSFNVNDSKENVQRNRELFVQALGLRIDQLAIPMQVHGGVVKRANIAGTYPGCDGMVTDVPQVYLCVSVADCVPIFIVDAQRKAVAAVHAGWRGTSARIVERAVALLISEFQCSPGTMLAYIGPCASVCCYSVGEDVAERFSGELTRQEGGKIFVDLKAANLEQLVAVGVPRDRIEVSPQCTICGGNMLHSYRRDRERSGRMMGVIGLKG
jgi:YfiH family protein